MLLLLLYIVVFLVHVFPEYNFENSPASDECNTVAEPETVLDESDNSILLYSLTTMVAWQGSIFISNSFEDVYRVKSDGNVEQIGARGRGPDEFSRSVHMYLNEDILYLMEVGGSYVSRYDLVGQLFLESLPIPSRGSGLNFLIAVDADENFVYVLSYGRDSEGANRERIIRVGTGDDSSSKIIVEIPSKRRPEFRYQGAHISLDIPLYRHLINVTGNGRAFYSFSDSPDLFPIFGAGNTISGKQNFRFPDVNYEVWLKRLKDSYREDGDMVVQQHLDRIFDEIPKSFSSSYTHAAVNNDFISYRTLGNGEMDIILFVNTDTSETRRVCIAGKEIATTMPVAMDESYFYFATYEDYEYSLKRINLPAASE